MTIRKKRSIVLDTLSLVIVEEYMAKHKVSFNEAVRQLIVKSGDESAIKLDRLLNQGNSILNKTIQAEKDFASIDIKTDEIKQVLGMIVQFLKKQGGSNG
jgi:hypothetical protein